MKLEENWERNPHPSVAFARVRNDLIAMELCVILAWRSVQRVRKRLKTREMKKDSQTLKVERRRKGRDVNEG